nr:E3 ubiquitin-protein ligase RNF4-like [Nomia melanderi]
MSDPIDIIDLTIDSPMNKTSKLRSKNLNRISSNSTEAVTKTKTTTNRRKCDKVNGQLLSNSVIEIPSENLCKNTQSTEIIDLDNSHLSGSTKIDNGDSCEEKTNALMCPICYEKLSYDRKPMSTRCGHIFCRSCLELAIQNKKRCPLCQTRTTFRTCITLHLSF